MKKLLIFIVLLIVTIPTFIRMARPGVYSMQDFHIFRLIQYDKCIQDLQIPCRWSPDAGFGYGEPVFNFYGQLPYAIGEPFVILGLQYIDVIKILFAFSLIGSAFTMFILVKKFTQDNLSSLLASIIYLYAPYRSVDVWVRGALSESMSFVLFPLIILKLNALFDNPSKKNVSLFGIFLAFLIVTHNLSVVMFAPLIIVFVVYKLFSKKSKRAIIYLFLSVVLSFGLSAFYLLPVIAESKYINLNGITAGYFDFRGHFTTIKQILFSNNWGYGGSVFGEEDGLNLSIGLVQWVLPVTVLVVMFTKKSFEKLKLVLLFILVGWFYLFLNHNKSTLIWTSIPYLSYIQFPWRFLGVSLFCFSVASGFMLKLLNNKRQLIYLMLTFLVMFQSGKLFREDLWYQISDQDLLKGDRWKIQMSASAGDYWPIYGSLPRDFAPQSTDGIALVSKTSNYAEYMVENEGEVTIPITYFPGWYEESGKQIYHTKDGLIKLNAEKGETLKLRFGNTPIRIVGNIVTFLTSLSLLYLLIVKKKENV